MALDNLRPDEVHDFYSELRRHRRSADEFVVADSDLFCLCELSGLHRNLTGLPRTDDDLDIARWASVHARSHHFDHFCRRILLHSEGTEGPEWQTVGARSDADVARILKYVVELQSGARLP